MSSNVTVANNLGFDRPWTNVRRDYRLKVDEVQDMCTKKTDMVLQTKTSAPKDMYESGY